MHNDEDRFLSPSQAVTVAEPPRTMGVTTLTAEAHRYARASMSEATLRAYRAIARDFHDFCIRNGNHPMPAQPLAVAEYLTVHANAGQKAATLTKKAAAIRFAHKVANYPSPTDTELVASVLRGIRRTIGTAQRQKAPATAEVVSALLAHVTRDTLRGKRDRALILLGFAGAFRRSELVALDIEDVAKTDKGLDVTLRRSKTDQEGAGALVAIPAGRSLKPAAAVAEWISAAGLETGPVFRGVTKNDRLRASRLSAQSVALVVKHYAQLAGIEADLSGHSLRAGFVTSAAERGADINRVMDQTRHRDPRTVRAYIRRADRYRDHAGDSFL